MIDHIPEPRHTSMRVALLEGVFTDEERSKVIHPKDSQILEILETYNSPQVIHELKMLYIEVNK